jgi:N-acyl-D-amino-acid deacylase
MVTGPVGSLLLRGGDVVDGRSTPPRRADLLLDGGHVADTPPVPAGSAVLDVSGLTLVPGFIDAHVHGEGPLLRDGVVLPALRQGVTTLVLGQDGCGVAPGGAGTVDYMRRYFAAVNGDVAISGPTDVATLLAGYDGRCAQNVAYLVPQGTVRHDVLGIEPREPTADELRRMRSAVERGLSDGAVGLSSGFDYVPSRFGSVGELTELCRPVAEAGRVYVSHLRAYGQHVASGLLELVAVGWRSGARVHASHLWGPPRAIARSLAVAHDEGLPVSFDMYPYQAAATLLGRLALTDEAQQKPADETARELGRAGASRLIAVPADDPLWSRLTLSSIADPDLSSLEGSTILAAAERTGSDPVSLTCSILSVSRLEVCVLRDRPELEPGWLDWLVRHQCFAAGSDGIYQGSHPHPRGAGTFRTLLRAYLRDGDGIAAAVERLSTRAADIFGLAGRGRLAPGSAADVVALDLRGAEPAVRHVIVNGVPVLLDGEPTGARPGRALTG